MLKHIKTIFIFFIIILSYTHFSFADEIDLETVDVNAELTNMLSSEIKNPSINSKAYVVIDRNTNNVVYGKNEFEKRKMASTTKIMTATVILEKCDLNDIVEVSKKASSTGGSRLGLKTGDKITVHDLLYGLLLCSGNDAAVALAEYCGGSISGFAELMNNKASELNLENTHFETPHGLDSDGHYTTAYELALLSNYALKNETFSKMVGSKNYIITINGNPKNLKNTNELLGNLNGIYGIKTGFTNGANRCLVTACKRNDIDIICVVLGADTKKFRTTDSIKLIEFVFNNYEKVNIQELMSKEFDIWKKNNLQSFKINKGISQTPNIKINFPQYSEILIRKDYINSISILINSNKTFDAPLFQNSCIGNLDVICNNSILYSSKLYNSDLIDKKNVLLYFYDFIKNYFYYLNSYQ